MPKRARRPWARGSWSACRYEQGVSLLHATAVAFGADAGILILGRSGAGKSSLALQLISTGAQLVADDRTLLIARDGRLFARAPRPIEGLVEARGVGLLRLPALRIARLRLAVDLDAPPARMPRVETRDLEGVTLPLLPGAPTDILVAALRHYMSGMYLKA
jgi:HPr kinase/phosphorylase